MKLMQVAIAFDQLLGTLLMNCDADETMSAKLWRCRDEKRIYSVMRRIVDGIFFWQYQHCFQSYLNELVRKQLPKEYQQNKG